MRKILLLAAALLAAVSPIYAGSLSLLGVGRQSTTAPAGYTGPGDIVSGAKVWWGLRCYNAAYAGNVADVWDGATGNTTQTTITCDGAGNLVTSSPSALATTCSVSCRVKIIYDQSGSLACTNGGSGVACDLTTAANGSRPTLTLNCIGSLPCMTFNGSTFLNGNPPTLTASCCGSNSSLSAVSARTGTFTTKSTIVNFGLIPHLFYTTSTNTVEFDNNNTGFTATANDSAVHAYNASYAGAASNTLNVDGTETSGTTSNAGLTAGGTIGGIGNANTGTKLTGTVMEAGFWPTTFTGTDRTNMCHNQFTYWGTATSC